MEEGLKPNPDPLELNIEYFIHRRAAKCAENICFMFAVERTANIKDNPLQMQEMIWAYVFYFLSSQQKVKRKIPLRSLRLERSGR